MKTFFVKKNRNHLEVKSQSIVIKLISHDVKKLFIDCVLNYKISNIHILEILFTFDMVFREEILLFPFEGFGGFSSELLTFAVIGIFP